jgi:CheY-like chemotaxis protein
VLLVEDDAVNQTIVASMLSHAGFSVELADNGAAALRLFAAQHFDLVITDWQMPDMDGLEVTRRLRSGAHGERGRTVPVVALTANAFAEDRAACLAAGMNDFLTKPVMANVLVRVANRWTGSAAPVAPPVAAAAAAD